MKNNLGNISEEICSGCGACVQKCPKQCIRMVENQRGFLVPEIDVETCVGCGICASICPERNNSNSINDVQETWAVTSKEMAVLNESTSGGMFTLLVKQILNSNGVVFGCSWDENFRVKHIKIDNISDLSRIQKSKYIQSDTKNTFKEAETYLKNGANVLYSGTGCQIAGLLSFLGKEYENLYTVEVACHGVPSPGLFEKYIKWLESENSTSVTGFTFRNKVRHKKGEHFTFYYEDDNGQKHFRFSNEDPFYASFLQGKTLRDTCYTCKYKADNHVGDILLSDYWGIEKALPDFDAKYGASAVLIYSNKGKYLFESISGEEIKKQKSSKESVVDYNPSLIKSSDKECKLNYSLAAPNVIEQMIPKTSIKNKMINYIPEWLKYGVLKKL